MRGTAARKGLAMTAESKRLKIMCLVSLFLGVAQAVCGFVIQAPLGVSIMTSFAPMCSGLVSLVLGVHGARKANVPSNAKGLRGFALVCLALQAAALACACYLGRGLTAYAAVCLVGLAANLLVVLFAHQVKRALDKA